MGGFSGAFDGCMEIWTYEVSWKSKGPTPHLKPQKIRPYEGFINHHHPPNKALLRSMIVDESFSNIKQSESHLSSLRVTLV